MDETDLSLATDVMLRFADATGLVGNRVPRRYLWTDSYAVCNFLELFRLTGETRYLDCAVGLVAQVHHVLGRYRADDEREGWLGGVSDAQAREHPTARGLRIGKPLPERRASELYDEQAEWEKDGQYYHYLTRWMHALNRVAAVTDDTDHRRWAAELAVAAHRAFRATAGQPRLHWKMSADLTWPLVPSSSHHDPLDGLVTAMTIRQALRSEDELARKVDDVIDDLAVMCRSLRWQNDDPLSLGGLLFDAGRLLQLPQAARRPHDVELLTGIVHALANGLKGFARSSQLRVAASRRLAFRELGFVIGIQVLSHPEVGAATSGVSLEPLRRHAPLGEELMHYWLMPANRNNDAWLAHEDINSVMLATCLIPQGFLAA